MMISLQLLVLCMQVIFIYEYNLIEQKNNQKHWYETLICPGMDNLYRISVIAQQKKNKIDKIAIWI